MVPAADNQEFVPLFKELNYPDSVIWLQASGEAVVKFTIDEQGFVVDAELVSVEGPRAFGDAAIEAAQHFRYAPQFVDGRPVPVDGQLHRFTFQAGEGARWRYSDSTGFPVPEPPVQVKYPRLPRFP